MDSEKQILLDIKMLLNELDAELNVMRNKVEFNCLLINKLVEQKRIPGRIIKECYKEMVKE